MTDQPQLELTEDERKLIEAYRVGNLPDAMRVYKRNTPLWSRKKPNGRNR
jgi:hypothetical protein